MEHIFDEVFGKAITDLLGRKPELKEPLEVVVRHVADKLGMDVIERAAELQPPERKIDGDEFVDWSLSSDGKIVWDGTGSNEMTPIDRSITKAQAALILNAQPTMVDVIALVNEFIEQMRINPVGYFPAWLIEAISKLQDRAKDSGFGCDLTL